MKKQYIKPMVVIDSFALSTSISAGCESIVGNHSENACGVLDATGEDEFAVFIDITTGCGIPHKDDQSYNGFCYHVPNDGNDMFNS